MTRFSDTTLHALIHIADGKVASSMATIHQAVKGIRKEDLLPAVERGWLNIRARPTGSSVLELTEAGEKWMRHLCDLSNAQPEKA